MFNLFRKKTKNIVGIDIGSFSIKAVEISHYDSQLELKNYGVLYSKEPLFSPSKNLLDGTANLLKILMEKADIKTKKAVVSLPVFTTFSTMIALESSAAQNLGELVKEEAKKYIPIPLSEVSLDWLIVNKEEKNIAAPLESSKKEEKGEKEEVKTVQNLSERPPQEKKEKEQVFVVAVPQEIINQYSKVIQAGGLELLSLEAESFSLLRSLVSNEKDTLILVDWGMRFVNVSIVHNGFLYLIHNIQIRADQDFSSIIQEIERTKNIFFEQHQVSPQKCVLSGGGVKDELIDILTQKLGVLTVRGNPFSGIKYSSSLENVLKEIGPQLAISAGLAMRKT